MKSPSPVTSMAVDAAVRKEKRSRRSGGQACILCNYQFRTRMHSVSCEVIGRHLQEHHVALAGNDPNLTVPLCTRCHDEIHEEARDQGIVEGVSDVGDRSVIDVDIVANRMTANFFRRLATGIETRTEAIEKLQAALDDLYPDWRELPEAKSS